MSICTSSLHTTVSLSYHPLAARPPGARARAHPDHSWPWSSEALLAGHAVWARFERPLALLHRPQPAPRPAAPTLQHRWGRRRPRPPSLAPAPPMARRNPDPRHVARDLNKIHPPWRYSSRWAQFKWARRTRGRSRVLPVHQRPNPTPLGSRGGLWNSQSHVTEDMAFLHDGGAAGPQVLNGRSISYWKDP